MRTWILGLAAALVAAACGGATKGVGSTNDATTPHDGGVSSEAGGEGDVRDASSESTDTGVDAGQCSDAVACGSDEWCDRGPGVCHGAGTCKKKGPPPPPVCPAYPNMYCGCDGTAYCDDADAHQAGVDIAVHGSCTQSCGPYACDALTQYCVHGYGGAPLPDGGVNEVFTCERYDAAGCAEQRTCACVQGNAQTKGEACDEVDGHVEVKHFYP